MKRKRKPDKQSLKKNVVLLFLSVGILAGVSLLFSSIKASPEFSLDSVSLRWKGLPADAPETAAKSDPSSKVQKSSAGGFEYSYWDILLLEDNGSVSSTDSFSVQIAAFKSQDSAKSFAEKLQKESRVRCTVTDTGTWSVVRWGSFHSRETADRYCAKLSHKLDRECIVVRK